jgi:hypothetical protein
MDLDQFSRVLCQSPATPLLNYFEPFRELCREIDVQALISQEMGHWLTQPRRPPPIVSENTVRLKRFGKFVLDVTVLKVDRVPQIICSHQNVLQGFCGSGRYDRFGIVNQDGVPARLRHIAEGALTDGDVYGIDGSKEVFVVHSADPVRFLSLCEFESQGIRYKFDSTSMNRVGTFAASPVSTTVQLAARFLGYYGDENCVSALHHLLDDPIGAIQWEAACALTRVAPSEGVAAMKGLSSSSDPDVAHAATEALQQLAV